jgi:hypothetical protein
MLEAEKTKIQEEKDRMVKAKIGEHQLVDPTMKIRFQNIEDPPSPGRPSPALSFVYGRYRYKESRSDEEPDTALRHGETYDLPVSVIDHLNSLSVPVYGHIQDPVTKALKTVVMGVRNRFSCTPVEAYSTSYAKAAKAAAESKPADVDPLAGATTARKKK